MMHSRFYNPLFLFSGLALLSFILGCSSGTRLYDLSGTISVDGKAPEGATIMFHPNDKKVTFVPTAHVGSDGKFKVVSDLKPGIPAGNYKVTVIWPDPSKKPSQSQMMTGLFEDAPDMLKGAFASPDKTPLAMEVTSSLKELPVLEIKTQ